MLLKELKPKKALNKAFLKVKPNRNQIEAFKANLITLLDRTNDTESEEFHKNLVSDFLKKTYYDPSHFINTKGRNDLVIHNGTNAKSSVGVIIEAKKPTNKAEMMTLKKLNTKAFQELVLYYLRERITHKNLEVKHLAATNINEWFIFDVSVFERLFAQNKTLVKQFTEFEEGRLADTKTDFFYKQIAEPFIDGITSEIEFTYFNIQDFQKPLRNNDKADDTSLIALFKLLSPEHLLKLPFSNDSNSLDKRFYSELLHIIGLTEVKEGSKKLIERNKPGERHSGTLLEDAIIQLDSLDKISRLDKPNQFGNTAEERLFTVALELSITWINRILFLKLLEAQLITYHKGDKSYAFLNPEKIKTYDDLNSLFFQVLARKYEQRNEDVKKIFEKVPYLNSSLFEPTDLEQLTLFISNLKDDKSIPVFSQTVLKDQQGKKRSGSIPALQYLFEFLDAYDFGAEGGEEIQEDNKTLINASVLGMIFEKINGYKDGSFFTPGFITMYMCRETIRKAVLQKFNENKQWNCNSIEELYDKIEDRKEANEIVNSIKICDPAVGSGHFLVSALNEMIAVKNDLKILQDRDGKRLKEYQVEVVNDELIVTDEDGELFEYNPANKESQRIQETLFHEKQTIIENCLFGVDINTNSVKICRLRLWIELLKSAYYKKISSGSDAGARLDTDFQRGRKSYSTGHGDGVSSSSDAGARLDTDFQRGRKSYSTGHGDGVSSSSDAGAYRELKNSADKKVSSSSNASLNVSSSSDAGAYRELETLPNIDINIKCGNSLVSRFAIDADLKQALKKSKWTIDSYRLAVDTYRNAESKEQKREMEKLIADIKSDFRSEISQNDPKVKKLRKLSGELFTLTNQEQLFEMSKKEKADWNKKVEQLTGEIKKLETEIEEIKSNKIFENAFEWRFEFPEVLNDDGDFVGFDVVIGNPPYVQLQNIKSDSEYYSTANYETYNKAADIYCLFYELGMTVIKSNGLLSFITSNKFIKSNYGLNTRKYLKKFHILSIIDFGELPVFDNASTFPMIMTIEKIISNNISTYANIPDLKFSDFSNTVKSNSTVFNSLTLDDRSWMFQENESQLINKLNSSPVKLFEYTEGEILFGIKTGFNEAFIIDKIEKDKLIKADNRLKEIIKPFLNGEDVRKYKVNWKDTYIILLKSGFQISDYPVLIERMNNYKKKLTNRSDKGKNWWDLRSCSYYNVFENPKILYPDIALESRFAIDNNGFIPNATLFCIPKEDYFLLGLLNSKLIWYYLSSVCPVLGDVKNRGRLRLKTVYLKNIPIYIDDFISSKIENIAKTICHLKKENSIANTTELENQIDQLVYQLYELTPEEIAIVEGSTSKTESVPAMKGKKKKAAEN